MLMHKDVEEVLLSLDQIVEKSEELGKRLSKDYEGKTPVFIALLKGAVPFFAEVIKHIECPMEIDFLDVSSYSGVNSTGNGYGGVTKIGIGTTHLVIKPGKKSFDDLLELDFFIGSERSKKNYNL